MRNRMALCGWARACILYCARRRKCAVNVYAWAARSLHACMQKGHGPRRRRLKAVLRMCAD